MCAAVPVQIALQRFIAAEVHEDANAPRHLIKRLPAKAPFYEMEDATRDLNFALGDREKHGQQLPLLLMLDNGSTAEDVPAYETLAHYDIPIVTVDHHHPIRTRSRTCSTPTSIRTSTTGLPNHDGDALRRTRADDLPRSGRRTPPRPCRRRTLGSIEGRRDGRLHRSRRRGGYDEDRLQNVSEALDYAAFWLRYNSGDQLIQDLLQVDSDDEQRHRDLVDFFADRGREEVDEQLDAAMPHLEHETLANGAHLYRIDVENYAHRFTYPAPGKTTGEIHDRKIEETGDPVITVGYGPDFAVLRSDGVRLDIPNMVSELEAEIAGGGVSGGGHLVVGSIKFVTGKREEVIDALVEKMAEADIDEALSSAAPIDD